MMKHIIPLLLLALAGCDRDASHAPIDVSVIGAPIAGAPAATDRGPLDAPAAALIGATGQGLVRFDAAGQVVPGLAARWIVIDNGRSLIFRLPDQAGRRARSIDAERIAKRIRAAIGPASASPLKPLLGAIDEVDAVTPQVIDVELKAPRLNMLQLFAQPALALGGARGGPFTIMAMRDGVATLAIPPDPDTDPDGEVQHQPPIVRLRGEPAGRAVARFAMGRARLVLGGRFEDLAIARAAALPDAALHVDPASGLFGLAFVDQAQGFTADPARRHALAMTIDRDRIARTLAVPGWTPATAIVAGGTSEIDTPAQPDWAALPQVDRQAQARSVVADWTSRGNPRPQMRIAMPAGPGARLLFALIAADWRAIGIDAVAVAPREPADLRLIDEVAPADVASFYLRAFACDRQVPCTPASDRVLIAARDTPSLAERSVLLIQADALIAATVPFIPFGNPVRWSLVAPGLDLYRDSPRAIHPLNELRSPLKR